MNHDQLIQSALSEVDAAGTSDLLEAVRIKFFGKNGLVTKELKSLQELPIDQKKKVGIKLNKFKNEFFSIIEEKKNNLQINEINFKLSKDSIDISLPQRENFSFEAKIHPITQTINEIISILGGMGLVHEEGPDIEDDFHNFSALNIPKNHPARQMHDTFYVKSNKTSESFVLRTHTSPVQIRALKKKKTTASYICTWKNLSLRFRYNSYSDVSSS